ncbi:MAG TPA: cytochrome c biogenesis protein CcsA [Terriglobales bacterium]|nr:cytochrome c biogenesis protein CcsA [Terriglobales bacterium]
MELPGWAAVVPQILSMSLFWLRVAVAFYGLGLLYALLALARRHEVLSRIIVPVMGVGFVLHVVSLTEHFATHGYLESTTIHVSQSLLAFLLMVFFTGIYVRYRTTAPGIFVFPLVFLLTFSAAVGQQPPQFTSPLLRSGWIFLHIALIFTGYAALFFSFAASLLYLLQERSLKLKRATGLVSRLPALEVIDQMGYRSLLLGFPFMTFGIVAGSVIAQVEFGASYFSDPKVALSLLMYGVYIVLLYTRWNSGWRGRRAAFLSTFAFLAAVLAWAANYVSTMHRFVAP